MKKPFLHRPAALAAGALLLGFPLLVPADETTFSPSLEITTGLAGEQAKITWPAQPGVRYRVEKSSSLSSGGDGAWSPRALVEPSGSDGVWVDPEPAGRRDFFRVPAPQPEVWSVSPTVLGPEGGVLILEGQCLPAGSSLVFEIEGAPPVSVPLMPGEPGQYRAALPVGAVVPGANILSAAIRGPGEVVILDIKENFAVTETGRATEPPPVLPPVIAAIVKPKTKSNQSNDRWGSPDDCDDGDPGFEPLGSLLMPALMKAKEKANRTKCSNNFRNDPRVLLPNVAGLTQQFSAKTSECKNSIGAIARRGALPGEVVEEECYLSLATPAGPPLEWTRTYRSTGGGGGGGGGWTSCYDVRIVPIPPAAGVNAARLYLYNGDGRRDILHRQPDGTYRCDGMFREGRWNPDTSFTLTFADKSAMIFCRLVGAPWSGRLGRVEDANGVGVDLTYTASSQLHTVTSQFGQSFTCSYGSTGELLKVEDHTGRFVAYQYYVAGELDGGPGDLKSVSCPQMPGQPPLAGPVTYTYTTGHANDRLNHNLLSVTDGAGRLLAAYTYSSTTDPLAVDFDTCATVDLHRTDPLAGRFATIKIEIGAAGYKMLENDAVGRLTEYDFDVMHRCVAVREYTGFATPGVPVTSTTNRPDPATRLRATDPDFYQTTFRYNADSCVTRITHPDGTQERTVYGRDLRRDCPVRERGSAHLITLRAPGGEERTVTLDYLPGFGTVEGGGGGGGFAGLSGQPATKSSSNIQNNFTPGGGGGPGVWDGGEDGGGCTDAHDHRTYTGGRFSLDIAGFDGAMARGGKITKSRSNIQNNRTGMKAKAWMVNNFEVNPVFGLKTEWITSIGLPKITPKISKESHGKYGRVKIQFHWDREGKMDKDSSCWTRMITSHGQVFVRSYDSHGNFTSSRTPVAGSGCDATYNSLGQCTSVTVLNGPGSSFRAQCTYDAATGWMTGQIQDPDINGDGSGLHITTTCERDNLGRVTRCVDPRGFDWLTQYDALDNVTRTLSPPVGNGPTASRIACDVFYDAGGLPARCDVEHRDATGAPDAVNPAYSSFIVYDNRARVVRMASEQRPVSVPTAPPVLDPAPLGMENFAACDFTWDDAGQCVRVSTPATSRGQSKDAACDYQFDECRRIFRCVSGGLGATGSVTVQTDYTSSGLVQRRMLLPTLPPPPPITPNPEITFDYDGFQRLVACTDPMGNVTRYEYDEQGFTTVSVFGSAGNVLLARGRGRALAGLDTGSPGGGIDGSIAKFPYRPLKADIVVLKEMESPEPVLQRYRPAFFDIFVADDVWTSERFTPGAPAPHPTETTTVHRSPAGLVMTVATNGDTVLTCTYDTAGRSATCSDGFVVRVTVRDASGNAVLDRRTDLPIPGATAKVYSWTSVFDEMNRPVSTTDGTGNRSVIRYDSIGRITQYTDPKDVVYRCRWDGEYNDGTPAMKPYTWLVDCDSDGDGDFEMLRQSHCMSGECRSTTNSNNYTTTFTCDTLARRVQCDFPDGTHETWSPDSYGRINTHVHKDGTVVVADFERDGRPDIVTCTSGTPGTVPVAPVDYRYDGLGRIVQCDQGDSHLVFTYDSLDNQLSEHHNGLGITRTFDHRGQTGGTYSDGTRFIETRNAIGQLVSKSAVSTAGTVMSPPITVVEYAGHRPSRETRANGVVTTFDHRADGEAPLPGGTEDFSFDTCVRTVCTNGAGDVIYATRVRRDRNQAVTQSDTFFTGTTQTTGRRHLQTWDRLGRLTLSVISRREVVGGPFIPESTVAYTFDLDGRRLTATGGANPGPYTQSALVPPGDHQMSQYSSWPGGPLEWDDEGSLTMMSSSVGQKQFIYDAASRLVAVNNLATGMSATYAYDAAGRRTRSSVGGDPLFPPVTTFFVYDGPDCIQELGGDGLPNITIASSEMSGIGLCIISRNGTLVYPHGGGGSSADSRGVAIPKFLDYMKKGKRSEAELTLGAVFASPAGSVTERTDCDDAGMPVFLTSDGAVRQGATGTLSGYDWFSVIWSPRSNISLSGDTARFCPETRFMQNHGSVYSPELGTGVSEHKEKPKPKPSKPSNVGWDLGVNKKV